MEESNAQQQSSAFPAPPFYFQRYTSENLALLKKVTSNTTPASTLSSPEVAKSLGQLSFPILALEPPPPVKAGTYWQFGRPFAFAVKVDQIRMIFINMHHILNEYRPHQARETLRLMMQNQLKSKQQETEALKKTCADLRKKLAALKALKEQRQLSLAKLASAPSSTDMDVDMTTPEGQALAGNGNIDSNARRTMNRLLMMADGIE
ncbi:Mediator of RNA polymerase II transcription subunit 7 [Gryganskiella cystojenkinii]|nr:Mediator of RNA polymerase II transcription subunit 7 [Gryganskiella cystojenkinii]